MKIACITDDDREISQHFGRARYYAVFTVEEGKIVGRELRPKMGHQQFYATETHDASGQHGTDPASHSRHTSMAEAISDCQALLCRGMGFGAYQSMQQVGITPVVTDVTLMEEAVRAYIAGRLQDHPEALH